MSLKLVQGTELNKAETLRAELEDARREALATKGNKLLIAKRWLTVMRLQYQLNEYEQQQGLR